MLGDPDDFWGKLDKDEVSGHVNSWHPLIDHCADVAACAASILALPTWRRRLSRLCGRDDLDDVTRARLSVLAALHDLGKFNLGFQAKGRPALGPTAGHVKEALAAIGQPPFRSVDPLAEWGEGTTGLLATAICHHGRPYALGQTDVFEAALWRARSGLDPEAGVAKLVAATREWFPEAYAPGAQPLPHEPAFEHAFAGLVMLADWIGSDTAIFRFSDDAETPRLPVALEAAGEFLSRSWLAVDQRARVAGVHRDSLTTILGERSPHRAQEAMHRLAVDGHPTITILESETGSGKTEAVLARFVDLFRAHAVDGLYFALPTRTAATQMYARIHDAITRVFPVAPPVVQAVPQYLRVDDVQGIKLPRFTVLWPDQDGERFRYRAWAGEAPKRYLSACIAVGTIDQVLLSSLMVGHAHLRATTLLRQLLVVDEVHASDAYMTAILETVLARHVQAGGHAVLLSATLGGETRSRLLRAGMRAELPALETALAAPYPLISHRGVGEESIEVAQDGGGRRIAVDPQPWMADIEAVATAAMDAARAGAHVLVVRNTVADCIETQRRVERVATESLCSHLLFRCREVAAPHHARFARDDRQALDLALEDSFGLRRGSGGCVVVATQTVQQSLDLDADLLITDLCPMDVLLQRIGRLQRHSVRPRPPGFEVPRAVVAVPSERDLGALLNERGKARPYHGLGIVYEDLRVLEATWLAMEESPVWRIPEMNRYLVERSVHSVALDRICEGRDPRWRAHGHLIVGSLRGEARQAELNIVDWTNWYSETNFPDGQRVPTRLGEDDRRVRFPEPLHSPFGLKVHELVVPGRWVRGVPADEDCAHSVSSDRAVTHFRFGGRQFTYDRFGLRLTADREDGDDDDGP